jgi:hypothetical protein
MTIKAYLKSTEMVNLSETIKEILLKDKRVGDITKEIMWAVAEEIQKKQNTTMRPRAR